ncbi:MAG: alpha/beta hydrolase [Leptolyngbya sp. SIO4C5]|nr:alpha/beta hydrolase [Leptolyngbya sp. SIO4C5]
MWQHGAIATNGIQLHFVTQGEGPLMLMLHGFPEFWYSWRHQIPAFAAAYKVVALDLRGYNKSDKPAGIEAYAMSQLIADVQGAIAALGYEDCVLVGHDWGGAIAWSFAEAYPQKVERLIVMNLPHPAKFAEAFQTFNWQQMSRSWYVLAFQVPWLPELILQQNDCQPIAEMLRGAAARQEAFTPEDLEAYRRAAAQPGALTAMVNYYRSAFFALTEEKSYGVLPVPTLLIWGEQDPALGKELTYGT